MEKVLKASPQLWTLNKCDNIRIGQHPVGPNIMDPGKPMLGTSKKRQRDDDLSSQENSEESHHGSQQHTHKWRRVDEGPMDQLMHLSHIPETQEQLKMLQNDRRFRHHQWMNDISVNISDQLWEQYVDMTTDVVFDFLHKYFGMIQILGIQKQYKMLQSDSMFCHHQWMNDMSGNFSDQSWEQYVHITSDVVSYFLPYASA